MDLLSQSDVFALVGQYGYWAVFVIVMVESAGVPLPGETVLVGAAIFAGQTLQISIYPIVAAAAAGAILGDNIGYWVGREAGAGLLERHGSIVGLTAKKLRLMRYLFMKYGGFVIFFGRFIALLRVFAAVLAGASRYDARKFMLFNASGGALWASAFGFGAYALSANFHRFEGPFAAAFAAAAAVAGFFGWRFYKANERLLTAEAEAYFTDRTVPPDRARGL